MIFAFFLALATLAPGGLPDASGYWSGSLVEHGKPLAVAVHFARARSHYTGTFSSNAQAAMDYPFDSVTVDGSRVAFVLGGGDMRFDGSLNGEKIAGHFSGGEGNGTFVLHRVAPPVLPYRVETVSFRSHGATLHGTLCIPKGRALHPAVVLLHGSGAQSRWGTLRFVADRLRAPALRHSRTISAEAETQPAIGAPSDTMSLRTTLLPA